MEQEEHRKLSKQKSKQQFYPNSSSFSPILLSFKNSKVNRIKGQVSKNSNNFSCINHVMYDKSIFPDGPHVVLHVWAAWHPGRVLPRQSHHPRRSRIIIINLSTTTTARLVVSFIVAICEAFAVSLCLGVFVAAPAAIIATSQQQIAAGDNFVSHRRSGRFECGASLRFNIPISTVAVVETRRLVRLGRGAAAVDFPFFRVVTFFFRDIYAAPARCQNSLQRLEGDG